MNYVKLNNNDNHLSLGNLFNVIKKISINKTSAIQTEIFCVIFGVEDISDTTVGNYCTGYRAIGSTYKQIYLNYRKHYKEDKSVLVNTINNLLSIIDGYIYSYTTIKELNNNSSLRKLAVQLNTYAKNDLYVPNKLKNELLNSLKKENYYEYISLVLFFTILDKIQPLYTKDIVNETIEEILTNTNISVNDLKDYLLIKFKEGISSISSLKKLAKNNNPYALHELGNLEYNGRIIGYPRYEKAFNYHKKAALYNHPTSYWMLAHMIINKKIGSLSDDDIKLAFEYINKAISLNSISAINTLGLCYLNGYTKNRKKDIDKAINCFKKAANKKYVYAYNNLGKIYEEEGNYEKAYEYYEKSALEEESWACNKLGLFYLNGIYVDKNIIKAFEYFNIGANSSIDTLCKWNIYNLVKYYYLDGNSSIGIEKNIKKSLELLSIIKDFKPAYELYLECYYRLYLSNKSKENLDKVNEYLRLLNDELDDEKKKEISDRLKKIYKDKINIIL
ncbi:MAG: tetratricopeptide repeat protein [Bacilli bacterium]|nr:tetratricopeptide repeat protein [Bacilli bacterium]